ncbi:MAG: hypothetical protein M3437_19970 [Chloroflexota bacterium]|nr:hypothetical protein [Chloroflexota bacterium]MDQ5866775.1 hypothetical protein [Chloroflexota bacterium]
MAMKPDSQKDEFTAQFMLAELNRLEARRETLNGLVNQRFQFYLTITAAAIVLITGDDFSNFATTTADTGPLRATGFCVLVALLGIGIMIFMRAVKADIEMKRLTEGVRWIKQFFVEEMGAAIASRYLLLPAVATGKIRTNARLTSLPAPIAVVNSVLISTLAVLIMQMPGREFYLPAYLWLETLLPLGTLPPYLWLEILLPLLTLLFSFIVHMRYMYRKYNEGDRKLNEERQRLEPLSPPNPAGQ